ncbi:MAG: hypothetical protein ACAI35_03665 [Candidatus Methylacidiphilales bacterium]|nr:hypothetical protein [Candidatus Methylacidiphilales bacterium]
MTRLLIALSIALLTAGTLLAEISPAAYSNMQNTAAERLTIQVSKVILTPQPNNRTTVLAEATVKSVKSSASGLKPGAAITIRYDVAPLPKGFVGPAPIPPLKEGNECPAYLTKEKDGFVPAARAYSFTKVGEPLQQPEPPPVTNAPATNSPPPEPKKPKKPKETKTLGDSPATPREEKPRTRIQVITE